METYKLSKEAEKVMKEIDGLEVDNDVKRRTADMIVKQTRLNIKSTMQSILESQRDLNEAEKNYKIRVTALQDALERLTNAKETESWYLSRAVS